MASKKAATKMSAPKTAAAKKAKPKKAVAKKAPTKKAAPKKTILKKAVKKPVKATRYCLGKCSCGDGCCFDKGHTGSHKCIKHA